MSFRESCLLLLQEQIYHPAPPHMLPRLPTMLQYLGVGAARFFQSIGQDREVREATFLVDCLGEFGAGAGLPGEPSRIDIHLAEGVADNITKQDTLARSLLRTSCRTRLEISCFRLTYCYSCPIRCR
jgi:hypothetical protein